MIRNPRQIMLLRLGATLCNFGGDSDSDSSTTTNTSTTNYVTSTDRRSVASDQAVSLTGDRNYVDRSTSNMTSFFDASNRSTNFADSSNRSTNFSDSSDHSTHITSTDYGSVGASLGLADHMSTQAYGVANNAVSGAIDTLKLQTSSGLDMVKSAFSLASGAAANSMQNSAQVLGFATKALDESQQAFAQAKDGGQTKMVMYALGAVAVIGVAFALKR